MRSLQLYAIFHCNLNYSSIEESQRAAVVSDCYWPLLRLARRLQLPIGIEMSGHTLEILESLDPCCLEELCRLTREENCELIGSGYSQIIGPLVPAEVNAANLRLGHVAYEKLLGFRPRIALINEQAFSSSLVPLYLEAGYQAIVMEWDNPFRYHPEWNPQWRFLPQYARSQTGEEIPLIWNNSISFQKFQRYACGDLDLREHLEYLEQQLGETVRAFPVYGNDSEVFGFRPGRYSTEPQLRCDEWERIELLFHALTQSDQFRLSPPSDILDLLSLPGAGHRLHLESAQHPVPVKKQRKYNVTRWATTGRNDLRVNTACWRIYETLRQSLHAADQDWKELCYLWSSDFRTHITDKRWSKYLQQLKDFEERVVNGADTETLSPPVREVPSVVKDSAARVRQQDRFLELETDDLRLRLNCQRGLAIDRAWFKGISSEALVGTLPHGYFPDIGLGADFYAGHIIFQTPGRSQITDLARVEPLIRREAEWIIAGTQVDTELGCIHRETWLGLDEPRIELRYKFDWPKVPPGRLRLGHITLNPAAFHRGDLFYRTSNGGYGVETFRLAGCEVNHGQAVSFMVSASHGLGLTNGFVELGDLSKRVRVEVDQSSSALVGMISFREVKDQFFCRLELSAFELDETAQVSGYPGLDGRISITAHGTEEHWPAGEAEWCVEPTPATWGRWHYASELVESNVPSHCF